MSDPYFIEVQHRPRHVAFLVDVDQSPETLFNEIVNFNVSSWGGRFNPVIPVLNGQVTGSYWQLLNLANPDILYTYCDISAELVRRIVTDVRPLDVIRHNSLLQAEHHPFSVRIDRQATVVPVLSRILEQFPVWARRPEPQILVFDYKDDRALSSFVRRNFGGNVQFQLWCRDYRISSYTVPADDREAMRALASNPHLVLPIAVCAEGPRKLKASTQDFGDALTLCYGTSPWNFVEYWNLAHFLGEARGAVQSLSELWIPPALLEDKSFYESFIELVRKRVFSSEHQHYVRLNSYDETLERMREVTKRICEDLRWNLYAAEPIVKTKGELPAFERRPLISMFQPRSTQPRSEQASGNSSFLELSPPPDAPRDRDERWIAEFAVENSSQERYFANKRAWWKLPQKDRIAGLFVPNSRCRVGNDYLISVEVSGEQQGVLLRTPELRSLFATLVLPEGAPAWAEKLDPTLLTNANRTLYIRSSDKGMYARGVLGLFESLHKAAYVFEHAFWRVVIESLCLPVASEQTRNKVRNDFERIGVEVLRSASGLDRIVDEVLDAAGRIQRPIHYINFNALFDRYWAYVKTLSGHEQIDEVTQTDRTRLELSDEKSIRESARANLRDMMSEFTSRKLFLQGSAVQCNHCLASLWYHVDDLRSVVTCRGCRKDVDLPAEVPWSYALNELVASAVRDHGVVPVIRTAFRLFKDSRECFCFLPGIEIRDYETDPETQVCELDLVWIRDGEFWIAEAKRSPKKFSVGKKLATVLDAALPDRFLLVSTSGTADQMQKIHSEIQPQLSPNIAVEMWTPDSFVHSYHPGWNIVTRSLFP